MYNLNWFIKSSFRILAFSICTVCKQARLELTESGSDGGRHGRSALRQARLSCEGESLQRQVGFHHTDLELTSSLHPSSSKRFALHHWHPPLSSRVSKLRAGGRGEGRVSLRNSSPATLSSSTSQAVRNRQRRQTTERNSENSAPIFQLPFRELVYQGEVCGAQKPGDGDQKHLLWDHIWSNCDRCFL